MDKTVLLRIRSDDDIKGTDGKPVQVKTETTYLGSLLSIDGRPARELTRRLGEASQILDKLTSAWKHANIPRWRKLQIFDACVASKLLYSLDSVW